MAKFARIFGKALKGASEVATPAAFDKVKRDAITKRDTILRGYQKEDQATLRTNQLTDQATTRAHQLTDQETARTEHLEDQQVLTDRWNKTFEQGEHGLKLREAEFLKTMENIQLQIDQGKISLKHAKSIEAMQEEFETADPKRRGELMESIYARSGKSVWGFEKAAGFDPETGAATIDIVRTNIATGGFNVLDISGAGGSGGGRTVGQSYADADGNSAIYLGVDDSGQEMWDDGSAEENEQPTGIINSVRGTLLSPSPPWGDETTNVATSGRGAAGPIEASDDVSIDLDFEAVLNNLRSSKSDTRNTIQRYLNDLRSEIDGLKSALRNINSANPQNSAVSSTTEKIKRLEARHGRYSRYR